MAAVRRKWRFSSGFPRAVHVSTPTDEASGGEGPGTRGLAEIEDSPVDQCGSLVPRYFASSEYPTTTSRATAHR